MTVAAEFARSRYAYVATQNLLDPILRKVHRGVSEVLESKQPTPNRLTRAETGALQQHELLLAQDIQPSIATADRSSPYHTTPLSENPFQQTLSETSIAHSVMGESLNHLAPSNEYPSPRLADEIGYNWTEFVDLFSAFSNNGMIVESSADQLNRIP